MTSVASWLVAEEWLGPGIPCERVVREPPLRLVPFCFAKGRGLPLPSPEGGGVGWRCYSNTLRTRSWTFGLSASRSQSSIESR